MAHGIHNLCDENEHATMHGFVFTSGNTTYQRTKKSDVPCKMSNNAF